MQLSCDVKTPLDLEYRKKSASFMRKDGTLFLSLQFDNKGESGGLLSTKSSVGYGGETRQLRANLAQQAKIKGMQKKAGLLFSPPKEASLEKLSFDLVGVDSNGKPYKLQKTITEEK